MNIIPTGIPGPLIIEPEVFRDGRGYFLESFNQRAFAEAGIDATFVQDNHSHSSFGVLRGLHYQIVQPQDKLVRVLSGEVFDVAVGIRRGSPTFGKHIKVILTGDNMRMLFVPKGFAHGFYVLSKAADFFYKCSDFYAPEFERGILWNDPDLAIKWPLGHSTPIVSSKDSANSILAELAEENLPLFEQAHV